MKTILVLFALSMVGCTTQPKPETGDRIPVYRPTQPISYPLPR